MTDHRVRISVSDLPLRERALSDSELDQVFGGCLPWCLNTKQCCDGKYCWRTVGQPYGICLR